MLQLCLYFDVLPTEIIGLYQTVREEEHLTWSVYLLPSVVNEAEPTSSIGGEAFRLDADALLVFRCS